MAIRHWGLLILGVVVIGGTLFLRPVDWHSFVSRPSPLPTVEENVDQIFHDEEALRTYVTQHGLAAAIEKLDQLSARLGNCHQNAHLAGHIAYEIYGNTVFDVNDYRCFAGVIHGATEAFFQRHGVADVAANVSLACESARSSPYFTRECVHGMGHGIMSWEAYQLPKALADCDRLPMPTHREYCYSGVFMENILASLAKGHQETTFVNQDLHYPCTIVADRYKSACYYFQPSRMLQLRGQDYALITQECSKINSNYQQSCFEGIGKETTWLNANNLPAAVAACQRVPDAHYRTVCLVAGAEGLYRDPHQQATVSRYCQLMSGESERAACFQFVAARTQELMAAKSSSVSNPQ